MKRVIITGSAALMLLAFSCKKPEKMSTIPSIKYTSFEIYDTTDILGNHPKAGRLKFYFEDGDGDVGLNPPEIPGDDSTNLFFKLYRISGGVQVDAPANDPFYPSDYRIPYLPRVGQNNILKGTISVTFLYYFSSFNDTVQYDFWIKDRANHLSNTATTCRIVLGKDSTYICN